MRNKVYRRRALMATVAALLIFSVPLHASKADSRIESTARQSYIFQTFLQGDHIIIDSRDGDVTLTGTVADNFNKSLAGETLAGIFGVKRVDNRLEIKGAPPATNSDAWIRDKVKWTLLFHRSVSASKTGVDVKDGIVTLQGEASSGAQKELTTEYARDVEGVKDVNNEMTVTGTAKNKRTAGQKIDDASVSAQVKMTLFYHRSTSALNTMVSTRKGVVTLNGRAKNAAEKNMAAKYAKDVNGVKNVNNRMTINLSDKKIKDPSPVY
ncbi:MAG: BON domain-containing protein [Smithellaceae bacterium]